MITLEERRKSASIIQKLATRNPFKSAKNKNAMMKSSTKAGMMSLGEKNLFREANQIVVKTKEETLKEQEKLNESLVL